MSITSDVIEYLSKNEDVTLNIENIAAELGYRKSQVSASIFNKRHYDDEFANRISIPSAGLVMYKSYKTLIAEAKTNLIDDIKKIKTVTRDTGNMYEQIGAAKNGDLILQDEEGNLFRATELT